MEHKFPQEDFHCKALFNADFAAVDRYSMLRGPSDIESVASREASYKRRCPLTTRWWRIKIQSFKSKEHFLQYAGRYVRRPPIAQRRITFAGQQTVIFWYKDKKLRRRVTVQCSLEEFIDRWSQHIPERYRHAVRSFGLFAPRTLAQTSAAIFAVLGQQRRPRPIRRRWADSLKREFGHDPLLDALGERMKWVRRRHRFRQSKVHQEGSVKKINRKFLEQTLLDWSQSWNALTKMIVTAQHSSCWRR